MPFPGRERGLPAPASFLLPTRGAAALVALLLGSCSFADETLLPTLSGENPQAAAAATEARAARTGRASTAATPPSAPDAALVPSADLAGDLAKLQRRLGTHRDELDGIRERLAATEKRYAAAAGQAETGSRTGDARVTVQRGEAETQLARSSSEVAKLNSLSTATASDGTFASYLVQAARAAAQGEADAGRRAQLAEIERGAARSATEADRLLVEIGGEIAEQSRRVSVERRRLAALGAPVMPAAPATAAPRPPSAGERRPLVTIRFDRPDEAYQEQLAAAVRQALQRRPDLAFDVVAVNPPGTPPADASAAAKREMEGVVRTLANAGVRGDKIGLSATVDPAASLPEVRVYVR
jgi:hypothetical protein